MVRPPRVFESILRKALPPGADWSPVLGDLREDFERAVNLQGAKRARRWYRREALRLALGYGRTRVGIAIAHYGRKTVGVPQDLRYAWRMLRRERATSAVIVLTLAVGIAAASTMFGVVDRLLLRPPAGVGHAGGVRLLYLGSETGARWAPNQAYVVLKTIADGVDEFAATALMHRVDVTIGAGPEARRASAELVTAAYFSLLEVTPAAGRFFTSVEDRGADADPVVVLSEALWQSGFNGDASVIGRDLLIEGSRLTIIGVAPRGFSGVRGDRVDLWVPPGAIARTVLADDWATTSNHFWFELVGRVAPGVSDTQVNAAATAVYRRALDAEGFGGADTSLATVAPLTGRGRPNGMAFQARVGLWLLGVAGVLVLIACANVAGLQLARTIARRREIGVRLAVGASRGRLLRQLLTESALLSATAAAIALLLTWAASRLVQQMLVTGLASDAGVADGRVLVVTAGIAGLTALVTGLTPMVQAWSTDVAAAVRPARAVVTGRTGLMRSVLLVTQVGLSVLLLVGAGLFVRSLVAVRGHEVGIDLDRVIQASLPTTLDPAIARPLYADAMDRLSAIPGVERVALNGGSLRLGWGSSRTATVEGMTEDERSVRKMDAFFVVTPGYFDTLGTTIESGRDLSAEDHAARARVAVVNAGFARRFWPNESAVGKCVSFGIVFSRSTCTTIVGVVGSTLLHNRTTADEAQLFALVSHPEFARDRLNALVIRTAGPADQLVPLVRQTLQSLTPDMGYVAVDSLESMLAPQLQPWRLGSSVFLACGLVALLIAVVGLYSALAFAVSQRTREIGVRIALGASSWSVTRAVGVTGIGSTLAGVVLGLTAAMLATPWLTDFLFQTSPRDPVVFALVAGVLAGVGVAASVVPARRAAAVDPMVVLRDS